MVNKEQWCACVCVSVCVCVGPSDPQGKTNGSSRGPCLTRRLHVVMDVDPSGSGLPARRQRAPFLHTAPSL